MSSTYQVHPLLALPQPLHDLVRAHLEGKEALSLAQASSWLLDLHRLGQRRLVLGATAVTSHPAYAATEAPPHLPALVSLLGRQRPGSLREVTLRLGEAAYWTEDGEPVTAAAAVAVPAWAGAAPAAAAMAPTAAGDIMVTESDDDEEEEEEEEEEEDGFNHYHHDDGGYYLVYGARKPHTWPCHNPLSSSTPDGSAVPDFAGLPVLPRLERLHLTGPAAAATPSAAAALPPVATLPGEQQQPPQPVTFCPHSLHGFCCPAGSPLGHLSATLLASVFLRPGVTPALTTLVIEGPRLLDDRGLDLLASAFEARHQASTAAAAAAAAAAGSGGGSGCWLKMLVLEPPSLEQGRGLSRLLLSGACDRLEHLSIRRANAPGVAAVARFLSTAPSAPCLKALSLYRRQGHLAWADPVADALAEGGAPNLESLHTAFLPYGAQATERLLARRLASPSSSLSSGGCTPFKELRLTAAGLRERDLACMLLGQGEQPQQQQQQQQQQLASAMSLGAPCFAPWFRDLRVLRLDFRAAVAGVLPAALASGACPRLECLGLVDCRLGDQGVADLAAALTLHYHYSTSTSTSSHHHRQHLRQLDLAYNNVGPDGARALAGLLLPGSALPALADLRLDGNPIGDDGLAHLAAALRPAPAHAAAAAVAGGAALTSLQLRRIKLGGAAVGGLAEALLAGGAPRLEALVLGTCQTPGMAAGDGSQGYVERGALASEALHLLMRARPSLSVRQEPGSPFTGCYL